MRWTLAETRALYPEEYGELVQWLNDTAPTETPEED
jgi:hypothetical protein